MASSSFKIYRAGSIRIISSKLSNASMNRRNGGFRRWSLRQDTKAVPYCSVSKQLSLDLFPRRRASAEVDHDEYGLQAGPLKVSNMEQCAFRRRDINIDCNLDPRVS